MNDLDNEPDSVTLRALGSIMHDYYTGLEQIFERIALEMEGSLPEGDDWHRYLLERMSGTVDDVRPAVVSESFAETLDEYLRFRHVFRHSYGFELTWDKCDHLVRNLDSLHDSVTSEIDEFKEFLHDLDNGLSAVT